MAIFKNNVAIKAIRAWVAGQIDLIPSGTFTESPGSSGFFLTTGLTESPSSSGFFTIPSEFNIGELSERQVVRAYYWDELGVEHVVFDGTQSQFVVIPTALALAAAMAPGVSSNPDGLTFVTATATASAEVPVVSVSVNISIPTATATVQGETPAVSASRVVDVPTASAQGQAQNIRHSPNMDVPTATATAKADNPTLFLQGSAFVTGATAAASAKAEVPTISANRTALPQSATAQGAAIAPIYNVSRNVTVVLATATAAMPVPVVTTKGDPMGMRKIGNQSFASSTATTPIKVTGWTQKAAWDKTVIVSDAMVMNGIMTNATLVVRGKQTAAIGTRGFRVFINGVDIGQAIGDESEKTITGLNLVAGDRVEVYTFNNNSTGRTVEEGDTVTYIYITAP